MDLEEVWRIREEEIYPALFGRAPRGIFPLKKELFVQRFGKSDPDPRWLHHGVIEFEPTADRKSWLYVTSGYSNPWLQDPKTYDVFGESGSGIELAFAISEKAEWAIEILQSLLAFDMLHTAGYYPGKSAPRPGDMIPLRAPINGQPGCALTGLIMVEAEGYPGEFSLPSGRVQVMGFTGASQAELDYGRRQGVPALLQKLRPSGAHPVTNPKRPSVLS